jgi:hypothetical protein
MSIKMFKCSPKFSLDISVNINTHIRDTIAIAQWLRHYATNRKRLDEKKQIFQFTYSSQPQYSLFTQPLTEMRTRSKK